MIHEIDLQRGHLAKNHEIESVFNVLNRGSKCLPSFGGAKGPVWENLDDRKTCVEWGLYLDWLNQLYLSDGIWSIDACSPLSSGKFERHEFGWSHKTGRRLVLWCCITRGDLDQVSQKGENLSTESKTCKPYTGSGKHAVVMDRYRFRLQGTR